MKVHPIQTLAVKAILDLPAPPQVWRINWNPDHQKVPRHPASVWRVSLLQLVSPKPCPHPQVLNLQVGFSSPAPRKRTWRMNSWLDLKKGSFGFLMVFLRSYNCYSLTLGFTRSKAESASRVARLAKVANNKFKKYGLLNKLYFFGSVGSGYFCYEKCI